MSASVPGGPHQSHINFCEERLQFSTNQLVLKRGQAVSLEPVNRECVPIMMKRVIKSLIVKNTPINRPLVAGIEQREAHLVWLLWGVLQHPVPGNTS